ncbi:MAG: stage III sporulation protein AF [Clostridia bacterium]|nr:stage III sporulation protein AF [Clostridia bacterium]
MTALRGWLFGVTVAAFAAALIELMNVRMEMKKTMRIVTGLFLLSVLTAPLAGLHASDLQRSFQWNGHSSIEQQAHSSAQDALEAVWQTALETAVYNIAQASELPVSGVLVDAQNDADGCINIQSVTVYTTCGDPARRASFAAALEEKLGCPSTVVLDDKNEAMDGTSA